MHGNPGGDRIRALLIYSKSVPNWKRIVGDTLSGALRSAGIPLSATLAQWRYLRFLVAEEYRTLSYVIDWREAFLSSPDLDLDACNFTNLLEMATYLRRIAEYDLVIVLHSAAGDNLSLLKFATSYLNKRRGKLLVFFGNEYELMPDKIRFARNVEAELIASQLPLASAQWLYADCEKSRVLAVPAALNQRLYHPLGRDRKTDIGFRGILYPRSIGDLERTWILKFFEERASSLGLVSDIQFTRHPADEWSHFLNGCKGIVGAEAGTYYLERDDRTQQAVHAYLGAHPQVSFDEIHQRFFASLSRSVSGKAISSRHFEAVGTKTCQILVEGQYNGILTPNVDYISVKKDGSDVLDAVARFKDETYRQKIVDRAFEYAMDCHTYDHRVRQVLAAVRELTPAHTAA